MTMCIRCTWAVLIAGLLAVGTATPAQAAVVTETVQGRYVRIVSSADWSAAAAMSEGASVRWDLTISANAPDPGTVRLGVSASGAASIIADVRVCGQQWQGESCPSGGRDLRSGWAVPRDGSTVRLDAIPADAVAHLRLDVRVGGAAHTGASTQVRVHADGAGDSVQVGPGAEGALPATGGVVPVPVVVIGGALVAAALVLLVVARLRRRNGGDS